jgi:hypothetical protein
MSGELVTVATFRDAVEAELARNYLEGGLIRAFLLDEYTVLAAGGIGDAVGGVKLQVHAEDTGKAKFLLSQRPPRSDDAGRLESPETAFATAETLTKLEEESEDIPAKDQAVDRLFRATVLGLFLWPIQLYATWLLLTLRLVPGTVSPRRRWKVWLSIPLNLPLMAAILCPLGMLVNSVREQPRVTWREHVFPEAGFAVRFPAPPDFHVSRLQTPFGEAECETYSSVVGEIHFKVDVIRYPLAAKDLDAAALLAGEAPAYLAAWNGKVFSQKRLEVGGKPASQFLVELPPRPGQRHQLLLLARFVAADRVIYIVRLERPRNVPMPPMAEQFLDSFRLR